MLGKVAALGADGRRWTDELPALIGELERRWGIAVGRSLRGGTESYVAEATTESGRAVVVKVGLPGGGVAHAIDCLLAGAGHGYVGLLAHDRARDAMLMERLGEPLGSSALPVSRQIELICGSLRRAWQARPDPEFPSAPDKAWSLRELIEATWRELGRPLSGAVMRQVDRVARSRADGVDPRSAVMAHGDPHPWNLLFDDAAGRHAFIDPEGLFIDPAYDLGVVMREWSDELAAPAIRCTRHGPAAPTCAG